MDLPSHRIQTSAVNPPFPISRHSLTVAEWKCRGLPRSMRLLTQMVLLLTGFLTGCSSGTPREAQTDDIRYVVFRYQLDHARPNLREKVAVYYFAVAEMDAPDRNPEPLPLGDKRHDPSEALLGRFMDHEPPVRKNSELQHRGPEDPKRSVRFRVTKIQWTSDDEVVVDGGHDDASSATWTTFTVRKVDGSWRVTKAETKRAIMA